MVVEAPASPKVGGSGVLDLTPVKVDHQHSQSMILTGRFNQRKHANSSSINTTGSVS